MARYEWEDLEGENALVVVGTIARLLKRLASESGNPALKDVAGEYRAEAMSGDYEHLMDVSHRYAYEHLGAALRVPEERNTYETQA